MKKYSVIMTRDCTESAEIQVKAVDKDEALEKASYEARNNGNIDWIPDDWTGKPYSGDPDGICEISEEPPEKIPARELTNIAMTAGNELFYKLVIDGDCLKEWIGIGWIWVRQATEEDYKTYPSVVRKIK